MMVKNWCSLTVLLSLALVQFSGCGGGGPEKLDLVPVTGTVTLDGEAHGPASLNFTPVRSGADEDRPVLGAIVEPSGAYTVTTYDTGDGAPPGKYTVTLGADTSSAAGSTDPDQMMAMMGGGGVTTQPLTVEIPTDGSESLDIKFVSDKTKKKQSSGGMAPIGTP